MMRNGYADPRHVDLFLFHVPILKTSPAQRYQESRCSLQGCTRLATHGLKASKAQINDCLIRCVKSVAALSSIQCTTNLRTCWAKQCRVNSIGWTKAAKEINCRECDLQHCQNSMCGLAGLGLKTQFHTLRKNQPPILREAGDIVYSSS